VKTSISVNADGPRDAASRKINNDKIKWPPARQWQTTQRPHSW